MKKQSEPEDLQYGWVKVTRGPLKDKVGFYDDDASESKAVVYFEEIFGPYYEIPHKNLVNVPGKGDVNYGI